MAARPEAGCYESNIVMRFLVRKGPYGCHESKISMCFRVCKGPSNDDVGAARGTVLQGIRSGAGLKTGDFVKESWGGYRGMTPQPGSRLGDR